MPPLFFYSGFKKLAKSLFLTTQIKKLQVPQPLQQQQKQRVQDQQRSSPHMVSTEKPVAVWRAIKRGTQSFHSPTEIGEANSHCEPSTTGGGRSHHKFHGGAEAEYFGTAVSKIPYYVNIPLLENALQDWSVFRFGSSIGGYAMDTRSWRSNLSRWS